LPERVDEFNYLRKFFAVRYYSTSENTIALTIERMGEMPVISLYPVCYSLLKFRNALDRQSLQAFLIESVKPKLNLIETRSMFRCVEISLQSV